MRHYRDSQEGVQSMEALKKTIAEHLRSKDYIILIEGKEYTAKQLAEQVEKETEVGKKVLEMAIKGTIDRYGKK